MTKAIYKRFSSLNLPPPNKWHSGAGMGYQIKKLKTVVFSSALNRKSHLI